MLFGLIRALYQSEKLKRNRRNEPAIADLLNYAALVEDGVIVCKSGALMAAFLYEGKDDTSSEDVEKEQVSLRINRALLGLGAGWALHVDAVRRPAPGYPAPELSDFPDPVSAAIDEERRRFFESYGTLYEGYYVLTLTWLPPLVAQRRFVEFMFDDEKKPAGSKQQTRALLDSFRREISRIEGELSSVLKLTRLKSKETINEDGKPVVYEDFLSWLNFCITGESHPIILPSYPMWLDALLGARDCWGGVVPRVGRNFIQIVAIDGFPLHSMPGMLSALAMVPCRYRWSSRYIFMDKHEAVEHLDKYRKKWKQKIRGFFDQIFNTSTGAIDQDALSMMQDAEEAMAEINGGLVDMGYYTSVVVLMDEDRERLEKTARGIERAINALGFASRVETINTLDAWMGSLPGHVAENVRRPLLNTMNLADLLPIASIWTGKENAPCPMYPILSPPMMLCVTSGATPFRLNLHVRDLGHTLILGPTGAGKSTHLAMIATQLRRYRGMSIYAFDKGLSLYALTRAMGGQHFSCGADDGRLSFCPLQFLETRGDMAWAMEWLDGLLRLNGLITTPAMRNAIAQALESLRVSGSRTISEFCITMQDETVREALRQYTIDGSMGHLLDAENDGLSLSSFNVFEIEELMNMGEKFALPVLLYLFRRIERALVGQPAAILLDEAWLMLGHPVFRDRIREWLKVMRKANCLVLMATQSLSDASNSGILDVIVESTATQIFLPNVHAREEETAALYRRMGLNARQIALISQATPKRHYYYISEQGKRMYDLALGPLALSLVAVSDKESIAAIQGLEKAYGALWLDHWLALHRLNLSNYISGEAGTPSSGSLKGEASSLEAPSGGQAEPSSGSVKKEASSLESPSGGQAEPSSGSVKKEASSLEAPSCGQDGPSSGSGKKEASSLEAPSGGQDELSSGSSEILQPSHITGSFEFQSVASLSDAGQVS